MNKEKKFCSLIGDENSKIWVVSVQLYTVHTTHCTHSACLVTLNNWILFKFIGLFFGLWIIWFISFFSIFVFFYWMESTHNNYFYRVFFLITIKDEMRITLCFFRFLIFVRLFIFKTMTIVCVSYHELSHARWSRIFIWTTHYS